MDNAARCPHCACPARRRWTRPPPTLTCGRPAAPVRALTTAPCFHHQVFKSPRIREPGPTPCKTGAGVPAAAFSGGKGALAPGGLGAAGPLPRSAIGAGGTPRGSSAPPPGGHLNSRLGAAIGGGGDRLGGLVRPPPGGHLSLAFSSPITDTEGEVLFS